MNLRSVAGRSDSRRLALLLACFFLSGLAALIYQTAWTRQLALVFGSSELAVATVLAAYMGGLALGAAVAGRIADRVARPILWYGVLELGIALGALALPWGLRAANAVHIALYGGATDLPDQGGLGGALFYLVATFLLLLPPTALMGATLPLLARHAVESDEELGGRIAQLYATNTIGAVVGTLATAFVLLPWLGVSGTILAAVVANAIVFVAAAALARTSPIQPVQPHPPARRARSRFTWIGPAIAISGSISFTYEVMLSRLLTQVLGGSVDAFAVMLASFLAGIALGSLVAGRFATDASRAATAFGMAQLFIAVLALTVLLLLDLLPGWMLAIGADGELRLLLNAAAAIVILLPLTTGVGATFPLAVRILARDQHDAAAASASIYAWNTCGAVAGALIAGFFLLPWLGFAGTVTAAIVLHLLLALASSEWGAGGSRSLRVEIAVVAMLLVLLPPTDPTRLLRSSPLELAPVTGQVEFFEVGRSAAVMVVEHKGRFLVRTNGLPEATINPKGARANRAVGTIWLSTLPSLLRPEAESLMVVGMGGGGALEFLPANLRRVDVVELEPAVVRANEWMADKRGRDPLADPRVKVIVNDARSALTLTSRRYDAIVSQPSHPWTAGSSHLYTHEFMALVRERLEPDGVFVQWMGLPFVDEALLVDLLATVQRSFANVLLLQPTPGTVVFAASDQPMPLLTSARRALAEQPEHYAAAGFLALEDVAAAWVLDAATAREIGSTGELITDDRNLLQMRSPAVVRRRQAEAAYQHVFPERDVLTNLPQGLSPSWIIRRLTAGGMAERAKRIAASMPTEPEAELASGIIAMTYRRMDDARQALAHAAKERPTDAGARHALWMVAPSEIDEFGDAQLELLARAAHLVQRRDFERLREIDAGLAGIRPPSLLYLRANRSRVLARMNPREGAPLDPLDAREARDLLDRVMPLSLGPADIVLRARAAVASGEPRGAIRDLYDVADDASKRDAIPPGLMPVLQRAIALTRAIPPDGLEPREREALLSRLEEVSAPRTAP